MKKKSEAEVKAGIKRGVLPLLQIKWKDHAQIGTSAWRTREEVMEYLVDAAIIDTVGWVIYEDEDQYILAPILDGEGNSRSEIVIFKNCVIQKRRIK
jgi:hypothetical protein